MKPHPLAKSLFCAVTLLAAQLSGHGTEQDVPRETLDGIQVRPSLTDPGIKSFDTPHYIYVSQEIVVSHDPQRPADRHELLLWIPGTQPPGTNSTGPGGAEKFCEMAARLGYHVIILKYPNSVSAAEACRDGEDPAAFELFRMALIAGGKTKYITISRTDSIENRLIKLLLHLGQIRPREDWNQFLNPDGTIKWERIAVAGQSQGGGHAALIAIKHRVARVICTGSPKDYSRELDKPAAWYYEESATPKACFFSFTHEQDHQGCTPRQQLENLHALKVDGIGPPANVDTESYPFHHTRILRTNYPGKKLDSKEAHTSVIAGKNEPVFGKVWNYMLTESVP